MNCACGKPAAYRGKFCEACWEDRLRREARDALYGSVEKKVERTTANWMANYQRRFGRHKHDHACY